MKAYWIVLAIAASIAIQLVEASGSFFVSEHNIGGDDFIVDFMKKRRVLVVKEGSGGLATSTIFDDAGVLKKELRDVIVQSRYYEDSKTKNESLESILKERDALLFTYDVTSGSTAMQQSVIMPSMLMSCRALFDIFKERGKVILTGSARIAEKSASSQQHSIVVVVKGSVVVDGEKSSSVSLSRGDLIYIPSNDDVIMRHADDVIYLNFTWSVDIDVSLDCRRESLHSLTQNIYNPCPSCHNNTIPTRRLNTGFALPPIGFGTARLFEKTRDMVTTAIGLGYTMIDTANIYIGDTQEGTQRRTGEESQGSATSSEQEIGRALLDSGVDRSELFIVTKVDPESMSFEGTVAKVEQSLKELQTSYLDVVLVHDFVTMEACSPHDNSCESSPWIAWRALEEMQSRGVVRSIGVSNINKEDLTYLVKEFSRGKVSLVQNWFDPFHQEREVRKICSDNEIAFMGYSTLGKVWTDDLEYDVNPVLSHYDILTFASDCKLPITSSVLRWAMERDVIVIPSSRDRNHMEQNLLTRHQEVDLELMKLVDDLDNVFGNPELPEWTKREFPENLMRKFPNSKNEPTVLLKDEL